jgi:hypothetical protein
MGRTPCPCSLQHPARHVDGRQGCRSAAAERASFFRHCCLPLPHAQAGIKDGSKLLLIGSAPAAIDGAKASAEGSAKADWDAAKTEEPLHKQSQHAKVSCVLVAQDLL